MKFLCFFTILFFFSITINAQQGFDPGYIVNHNRDTIRGFIEVSEEKTLSSTVHFKKEINGEQKEYKPTDLFGFGIGQEPYRSMGFINTIDGNKRDTVFARQLVSGRNNLFTFETSARFFLLQSDTSIILLYDESQDGAGTVDRVANFRNYLNYISITCDRLKDKYLQVGYSEGSIAKFVQQTNTCVSGESSHIYGSPAQKLTITPIIYAGGLPLSGQEKYLTGNFSVRFTLPRIDKKLSLNIGVNYTSTTYSAPENQNLNPDYWYYTKATVLSFPVTVQYNILLTRVQPYFNFGFSYGQYKIDNLATGFWVAPDNNYNQFSVIGGVGVEVRIVLGLFVRAEYRFEPRNRYPGIGLSYHF
jgi:opacity protein-like surface antigen